MEQKNSCQRKYKDGPIEKIEVFYQALNDSIECEDKNLFYRLLGENRKKKEIKIAYEEYQDIEPILGFIFHTWQDSDKNSIRLKTDDIISILDFKSLKKILGKGFRIMDQKDSSFTIFSFPDYLKIKEGELFLKVKKFKNYFWIDSLLVKKAVKPVTEFNKFHEILSKAVFSNNQKLFLSLFRQERILSFAGISDHYLTNEMLVKQAKGFELKMLRKPLTQGFEVWQKKGQKSLCDEMVLPVQPSEENAVFVKRGMELWVRNCDGLGWEIHSLYQP